MKDQEEYLLNNIENYKNKLDIDFSEVTKTYAKLIYEYFKFATENINVMNKSYYKFIIIRGLDTITNVFLNLLYYTKNINLTYFYCEKSFYFYIEFVSQICNNDEEMYMDLTTKDASIYVYKKTIFEINNKITKCHTNLQNDTFDTIKKYINIFQTYFLKIIQKNKIESEDIENFISFSNKLNTEKKINIEKIDTIIEKLYYKISDVCLFLKIINILIKKPQQEDIKNIEKNIFSQEFEENLSEKNKFINWLFTN